MDRPRILVTRTRNQASDLAARLEALGAEVIAIPMIEIVPPSSYAVLDTSIAALGADPTCFEWLVFTSANAVESLASRARLQDIQLHPTQITQVTQLTQVAAIGPATAKAIEQAGLVPRSQDVFLPKKYVAESLAEALLERSSGISGRYLLVRAEEARDVIPSALEAAGHRVTIAAAYRNITPPDTLDALTRLFSLKSAWPDVITFTSSSTARNLVKLLQAVDLTVPSGIALASIGPITSTTLRELGYEPTLEAAESTIESLLLAIAKHLKLG